MQSDSNNTDEYLAKLPEWQQGYLREFRELVHAANPDITETIKWGVPVFMLGKKMVFAMSAFKAHVKYNFIANGAALTDTASLFNNGMESSKARAIDIREGESVNSNALKALIEQSLDKL